MASSFKCTLQYLPPERFEDEQPLYDDRTDVWSLGITLVEIVFGDTPYNVKGFRLNEDYAKIMNIIKNANGDEIMSRCFGEDYSDDLRYFVKSCLNELSSRPRYQELIETNLYKSFVAKDDNKNTMEFFLQIYSVIR
jgi:serine/threonine protein kinase